MEQVVTVVRGPLTDPCVNLYVPMRFRPYECKEAAALAMLSPLSREASVGMLFTKATHCEKSLEYARRRG